MSGSHDLSCERKYDVIIEVSQRIRETLDLEEILQHLLDSLRQIVDYDAAGIFVLAPERRTLPGARPRPLIASFARRGFDDYPPAEDEVLMHAGGIVGHVIRTGETVVVPDVRLDPRYFVGRARTRSEITVPLVRMEEPIGALNLESDRPGAFDASDVEVLRFFADVATMSLERAMLHDQLMDRRRVEDQMRIAQQVQARLLPGGSPEVPGYDIAGICIPTFDIGGDYFDYIVLDDDRIGLVIADVSGKGVSAALSMSAFRSILRMQARGERDPGRLALRLNELLPEATARTAFVTAWYGVLEQRTGRLVYTNCGHNPPLLMRSGGGEECLERGGTPLGMLEDVRYESGEVIIGSGDLLVLYTDGVVECVDADGREFGARRLKETLSTARHLAARRVIEAIIQATEGFTCCDTFADDFTVVALRRP